MLYLERAKSKVRQTTFLGGGSTWSCLHRRGRHLTVLRGMHTESILRSHVGWPARQACCRRSHGHLSGYGKRDMCDRTRQPRLWLKRSKREAPSADGLTQPQPQPQPAARRPPGPNRLKAAAAGNNTSQLPPFPSSCPQRSACKRHVRTYLALSRVLLWQSLCGSRTTGRRKSPACCVTQADTLPVMHDLDNGEGWPSLSSSY